MKSVAKTPLKDSEELELQPTSHEIWDEKYRLKDGDKALDLTVDDTWERVAEALASVETTDKELHRKNFIWALQNGAIPAGRIVSNAGAHEYKPATSTINCTVSGTIVDSMQGILEANLEAGLTLKAGCGIGYEFSTLRPRGAMVRGAGAQTSGPLSFMDIFDKMCFTISSAGGRRGAQMATFDVHHPDVMDFIKAKREDGTLRQFNLSLLVTDEFLDAVKGDKEWALSFPIARKDEDRFSNSEITYRQLDHLSENYLRDSEGRVACLVYNKVRAKDLWEQMMRSTYDYAEPGFILIDRVNEYNNNWFCENIRATNPCFTGDTRVWTDRGHIPFRDLAGSSARVLTQDHNGQLVYRTMRNIRVTQRNAKLVEVRMSDGQTVRCTPNHQFFLKDGSMVEAKDLKHGMSLESVYRYKANQKGYLRLTNGLHTPLEHHVPFEGGVPEGYHVHHLNGIKDCNYPENLELILGSKHNSMHMLGDLNPMRRFPERNHFLTADFSGNKNGRYRSDLDTQQMMDLRSSGMSYRNIASTVGCSPYTARKRILEANHRVVGVIELDYVEDVYCGSVDEFSRFFIATGANDGVLVHNCGEQPLPPHGSCLLGSVNLTKFVNEPFTDRASFDWDKFRSVVAIFTRMLDNVVEINGLALPEQIEEIHRKRRHGMGFLGLGSTLAMLRIKYGEKQSLELTEEVSRELALAGWREGVKLAREKGPAPIFNEEHEITAELLRQRPELKEHYALGDKVSAKILLARYSRYMQQISEVDQKLVDEIAEHGCRFTHHSSIAPTGTISLSLANNASNGIEPSFAHHYSRNVIKEGRKSKEKMDVFSYELLLYRQLIDPSAKPYPKDGETPLPEYFVVSDEITPEQHVDVQAAAQKWVDSSISKTINVPTEINYDEFKDIYLYAYDKGLKGCTTFRFNPEAFQGVLVKQKDLENTTYVFETDSGETFELKGHEEVVYDGETHTAANLYEAIKEGYYGKF